VVQRNIADGSSDHRATCNADREVFLKTVVFTRGSHSPEPALYIVNIGIVNVIYWFLKFDNKYANGYTWQRFFRQLEEFTVSCCCILLCIRAVQINIYIVNTTRVSFSGIWHHVVRWVSTDVSEEHIASIFRAEEIGSANREQAGGKRRIQENDTLHNHRCENLKSNTTQIY
jgi:hypothetical protein